MSKYLSIFCLIFISVCAYTQNVFTLQNCIQHANLHNLDIRKSEINRDILEKKVEESKGRILPTINTFGEQNYNFGRTIDPENNVYTSDNVNSTNFALSGSITLFDGFQTLNAINYSKYEFLAGNYDLELVKNQVSLQITSVYLQVLFNQELVEISEKQIELTEEQLSRMTELVEAGKQSPTVLPDLEAQLASEEVQLVKLRNLVRINYLNLAQLINAPVDVNFVLVRPELVSIPDTSNYSSIQNIYSKALITQPEIKKAEYKKMSSQKSLLIAKGRRSPKITLNGSISTVYASTFNTIHSYDYSGVEHVGYTSGNDSVFMPVYTPVYRKKSFKNQLNENLNKFVGVKMTIPILNNYQIRTSIEIAKLGVDKSKLDLDVEKYNLQRKIIASKVDAMNAFSRLEAAKVSVMASEEALRNAEIRLGLGSINSFEYGQVKNRLAQSNSELLQAKYEYIFKTKILDFYKGEPLKL